MTKLRSRAKVAEEQEQEQEEQQQFSNFKDRRGNLAVKKSRKKSRKTFKR